MNKVKDFKHENMFKVLEVDEDDDDDEQIMNIHAIERDVQHIQTVEAKVKGKGKKGKEGKEWKVEDVEDVKYVRAVHQGHEWLSLGKGDIVVDSAADESCWPAGQGDAFPTKPSARRMLLKTANGGEMTHYG